MFVQMAVLDDDCSRYRRHLQLSFSSQEEKETYLRRFEAARLLLAPGVNKRKATISVLIALLDRVLAQTRDIKYMDWKRFRNLRVPKNHPCCAYIDSELDGCY